MKSSANFGGDTHFREDTTLKYPTIPMGKSKFSNVKVNYEAGSQLSDSKHQQFMHESISEEEEQHSDQVQTMIDKELQDTTKNIMKGGSGSVAVKVSKNMLLRSPQIEELDEVMKDGESDFIAQMVEQIWDKYDVDRSGALDKIETANFLNEILTIQGQGPPSMEQFNRFFAEFDINQDGVIQRNEMAKFIRQFVFGEPSYPIGEHSSLI